MTRASIASSKPAIETGLSLEASPPVKKKAPKSRGGARAILVVLTIAVLGLGALGIRAMFGSTGGPDKEEILHTVARADLRIDVVESGSLESGNSIDIKNQVEGRPQILKIVPEGTFVEKGQILCELDASTMVEREMTQSINYERASAAFIAAQKSHEIKISDGESQKTQAQLDVYFAEIDLKKYEEGDWPTQRRQAEVDITIAEEELKRARDKSEWSEKLAAKGFITRQELEADQLAVTKREIDLELAERNLDVLSTYTYEKDIETLRSNHQEAERNYERVVKQVERELVQSEADLKSKEATYNLEKEQLDKLRDQISKATIIAPQAGLLVYANSSSGFGRSNQDPIQEGSTVRERQTIFKLPDVTNMVAKIKIHESSYERVSEGLKTFVRVDAFPDRVFPGRLSFVAPLPDSQQWWMNPDLKVYSAEVKLGGDTTMLKPGMSCSVEIEADLLEEVISVPVQAIFREGETNFCYVEREGGVTAVPVMTGLHNDKMIHVREVEGFDSLREGDRVYIAPPRGADDIEVPEVEIEGEVMPDDDEFPEMDEEEDEKSGSGGETLTYEEYKALPDTEKRSAFMRLSESDRRKAMQSFMGSRGGGSRGGGGGRPSFGGGR